jgi:hypothetical protein
MPRVSWCRGERTPVSVALLDRFAPAAATLLGGPVLPVRTKVVEYHGEATWHRDSDLDFASVGVRVLPRTAGGRHRCAPGRGPVAPPDAGDDAGASAYHAGVFSPEWDGPGPFMYRRRPACRTTSVHESGGSEASWVYDGCVSRAFASTS